jgi:uncharacterized membrane protein
MLNPSRTLVILLALVALVGLVLGLATGVGLFGWSLAALIALYLAVAGLTRLASPRLRSHGTRA